MLFRSLDLRAAEDQGTECIITDGSFDTQFPLNINDADISPDSTELPKARVGPTDLTFNLIRWEICSFARKLHQASTTVTPDMTREETLRTLEEREALLLDVYNRLEAEYLGDSSTEQNPMYFLTMTVARLIVAKMITVIYQPVLFSFPADATVFSPHLSQSCRLRERLFIAAIEIFEYNQILNTDPRCRQWRWLIQTYTQWHAVAYLLLELGNAPWSATSERAWAAINACLAGPDRAALQKLSAHTAMWLPLKKLCARAKKHRDAELARLRADPAAAEELEKRNRERLSPSTFGSMANSIKCHVAHERWRKLVNIPDTPSPLPGVGSHQHENINTAPPLNSSFSGNRDQGAMDTSFARDQADDQVDDIIEAALANPHVNPTHIFSLAFHHQMAQDADDPMPGAAAVFGHPPVDVPAQHDHGLSGPHAAAPKVVDDDPPLWLWGGDTVHRVNRAAAADGLARDAGADVSMDEGLEGFDWQNWQESARGFELETNGTGMSGAWSMWYG